MVRAIATAPPGAVLYHCGRGRDRTGLVTILVLALAGVRPEAIVADYELSLDGDDCDRWLEEQGTTHGAVILGLLEELDVERYLLDAGVAAAHLDALRARLVG